MERRDDLEVAAEIEDGMCQSTGMNKEGNREISGMSEISGEIISRLNRGRICKGQWR